MAKLGSAAIEDAYAEETVRGTIMAVAKVIQVRRETVHGTIVAVRPKRQCVAPLWRSAPIDTLRLRFHRDTTSSHNDNHRG